MKSDKAILDLEKRLCLGSKLSEEDFTYQIRLVSASFNGIPVYIVFFGFFFLLFRPAIIALFPILVVYPLLGFSVALLTFLLPLIFVVSDALKEIKHKKEERLIFYEKGFISFKRKQLIGVRYKDVNLIGKCETIGGSNTFSVTTYECFFVSKDGTRYSLTSKKLWENLKQNVYPILSPMLEEKFSKGQNVNFGCIQLSLTSINHVKLGEFPLQDIEKIKIFLNPVKLPLIEASLLAIGLAS